MPAILGRTGRVGFARPGLSRVARNHRRVVPRSSARVSSGGVATAFACHAGGPGGSAIKLDPRQGARTIGSPAFGFAEVPAGRTSGFVIRRAHPRGLLASTCLVSVRGIRDAGLSIMGTRRAAVIPRRDRGGVLVDRWLALPAGNRGRVVDRRDGRRTSTRPLRRRPANAKWGSRGWGMGGSVGTSQRLFDAPPLRGSSVGDFEVEP